MNININKNKYYKNLELHKILDLLADKTSCEDSKNLVQNIVPSSDLNTVQNLLTQTDTAYTLIAKFKEPSFYGLSNIRNIVKRAVTGASLNCTELIKISTTLQVFNNMKKFKDQFSNINTVLDIYFNNIIPNKYLENKIKSCIVSEDEIADDASPELLSIRRKIRNNSEKIRNQLNKMLHSLNIQKYLQDNVITIKSDRFVLPVKSEFKKEIPGLVHETSASGATLFIEPMSVVNANNEIKILRENEKKEISKILKNLSIEVASFSDNILASYDYCIKLDVIFAKALLAYDMKAVMPKLNNSGKINLKKARHPLINKNDVVPINVSLGIDFNTLVITGPNTGGKTVTLKTVGLLVLMTMCGLMIPVSEESEISIFEHVLSDIGDEQSIEQSLSTFSSHITNIINILKIANSNSLILLDELGAGTDPVEGAALAISILEKLKELKCKVLATTHYSELKAYAISAHEVQNASCQFDIKTLKPTYNLLIGSPGKSNAFAISERLGISKDIIENAKNLVSNENLKFENAVTNLENAKNKLDIEKLKLEELRNKISTELSQLQKEKEEILNQREEELQNAKIESEKIVSQAKRMALELIDKIKEIKKHNLNNNKSINALNSQLDDINNVIDPIEIKSNNKYTLPRKLKIGDEVLIFDIDKKAKILDINSNDNEVIVQAGMLKTRVPIDNIRLLKSKKQKYLSTSSVKTVRNKANLASSELDVRGKDSLEAILEVDNFIDSAVLAKIYLITIIHGKGTGVLRSEISKHLKRHKNVKSFRPGNFGEGEFGVTVVELK